MREFSSLLKPSAPHPFPNGDSRGALGLTWPVPSPGHYDLVCIWYLIQARPVLVPRLTDLQGLGKTDLDPYSTCCWWETPGVGAERKDLSPHHRQLPVGHRHLLSQPALNSRHLPAFLFAFISPPSFLLGCLWEWISTHLYYGDPFSTLSLAAKAPPDPTATHTSPGAQQGYLCVCSKTHPWQETVGPGIESKCRHNTRDGSVRLPDTGGRTGQTTRGPCRKNTYLFPLGDAAVSWTCLVGLSKPLGSLRFTLEPLSSHRTHSLLPLTHLELPQWGRS